MLKILFLKFLHAILLFQVPGSMPTAIVSGGVANTFFYTGQSLGTARSNFTGSVGFSFETGKNVSVKQICRWIISGNSQTHGVYIVNNGGTSQGSVSINTTLFTAGQLACVSVTPFTLTASTIYAVLSCETNGGDQFYDDNTTVSGVTTGFVGASVFSNSCPPGGFTNHTVGSNAYVPTNFNYQ